MSEEAAELKAQHSEMKERLNSQEETISVLQRQLQELLQQQRTASEAEAQARRESQARRETIYRPFADPSSPVPDRTTVNTSPPPHTPQRSTSVPPSSSINSNNNIHQGTDSSVNINQSQSHQHQSGVNNNRERNEVGLASLLKSWKAPEIYDGLNGKSARAWADTIRVYLNAHLGNSQIGRLQFVFSRTSDAARQWIKSEMETAEKEGKDIEWCDLEWKFVAEMEGPYHTMALYTDLLSLRYGKGNCKDLRSFNQQFDILTTRIMEGYDQKQLLSLVWGLQYAMLIRNSDSRLYDRSCTLGGVPVTLEEWKTNMAKAVATKQISDTDYKSQFYSTQRSPWQSNTRSVSANNTTASSGQSNETALVSETQRPEGVSEADQVAIQAAKTNTSRPRGWTLSTEQMEKLKAARRCFRCYKKAEKLASGDWHSARNCMNQPPQRPPNAEELKA
jgi:hypothetical protein